MQEMKKKNLFKLKPKLAWGHLKGKKEDVKGHFTNEEMLDYVQRLYMHEGVAPMVEKIETPCTTCIDIDDVNKGIRKMANRKAAEATYVSSELLKWTLPHTRHWLMTIIEQAINKDFQMIGL